MDDITDYTNVPDVQGKELSDMDDYELDDEERYGENPHYVDQVTGEEYYYSLNGDKYYVEAE